MTPTAEHPTIQIEGFTYALKFGPGAQLRLERMGLTLKAIQEAFVREEQPDGTNKVTECRIPLTMLFTTIAACAGQPKLGGGWKAIKLSPEEIADMSTPADIKLMAEAVATMWSKVQPEGTMPATVPASAPNSQTN